MVRFSKVLCLGLAICALVGCKRAPPAAPPAAAPVAAADSLSALVEQYWNEHIPAENVLSAQRLADALAVERRYRDELATLPRDSLDAGGRLTYDLFKQQREIAIEGFTYPEELLPLKPFDSPPFELAAGAVATGQRTLSAADYAAWLKAVEACSAWVEQAHANLREGLSRGYTEPRLLIEHLLAPLQTLSRDQPDNPFYMPLKVMADSVPPGERERLSRTYSDEVAHRLLPALKALHDFLAKDYLPKARTTLSLTDLPLGPAWYTYRLKRATGTDRPAGDLHKQGLAEVEKLKARGLPVAPPSRAAAELLGDYLPLEAGVAAKLGNLFETSGPPPVLPVVAFEFPLEGAAPVNYQPARLAQPATLFVYAPAGGARFAVADFLAAGLPGAYWRELALQGAAVPSFRRYAHLPTYEQGWDVYAASLGEELGVYTDETAKGDWQMRQLRCAAGLVIDTGLHAQGWTRDKALDYLHAQTMIDAADADALVDRIVASPGDAAACALGALKFQQLRARAQQVLGARFDFKEFHTQLLGAGELPLDELEARVKSWLEAAR